MIIVTAASQNHFHSLKQLLRSFLHFFGDDESVQMIVYNLGIKPEDWETIVRFDSPKLIFKEFQYQNYPNNFNVNVNGGDYAWKAAIVYETYLNANGNNLIWMDAGDIIIAKFDDLLKYVAKYHIHSCVTNGTVKDWTHPKTIKFMNAYELLDCANRNTAFIAFNTSIPWIGDLIKDWYDMSLIKECIAPIGSDRSNHRQDQAVFTLLYYFYKDKYKFDDPVNFWYPYYLHHDCD